MIVTSLFSMWRIKKNLKVAPVRSDRLDILVQKIMKFSIIYLLPKSKYFIVEESAEIKTFDSTKISFNKLNLTCKN